MTKIMNEAAIALVLKSKDEIKADQDGIRTGLLSIDQAVHSNAVQCLMHAEKHGDTSLMRRLLVEIVDAKTGYRRQGLINWMRKWSPMELKGDTINLSGTDEKGAKREFQIAKANATPFWTDRDNAERVAKPVFKDTLMSKVNTAEREFRAAILNTSNGKPIDPSKPFYDGLHSDKIVNFFDEVAKLRDALPADATNEVRKAQKAQAELGAFIDANKDNVNKVA